MHLNHSQFRARIALILTRKKRGATRSPRAGGGAERCRAAAAEPPAHGSTWPPQQQWSGRGSTTQQPKGKMGKEQPPVEVTHF